MKLAYLILGHAHPEQIVRMIGALRPSASLFVVHVDRRADASVYREIERYAGTVDDVLLARRHRCNWGSYGIMRATFACVAALLESGVAFDYAALVSGQDYPVRNAAELAEFFEARAGREFIEAFPLAQPNRWTPQGGRFQAMSRVEWWTVFVRSRAFSFPAKRRFYMGWVPCGGSQWWCLSRAAVEWIDHYLREHPGLGWYFRFVFIPDEAMIQTMMANSPFRERISEETLTYIDWERPNPKYPRTLEDDEDFARARKSGKLFARKMDPVRSKGLLARLDREVLRPVAGGLRPKPIREKP
jgi:hypothetical protein